MAKRWMRCFILFAVIALSVPRAYSKDVTEKFDDGSVHLRYRTDMKDRKNGDYQEFFRGGKTHIRGTYTADEKTGTWTTYSETGKTLEVASYSNDILNGPCQRNWPTGVLQMRGNYHNGELEGALSTFDEKGSPVFSVTYPIAWEAVQKAWNDWNPKQRPDIKMLEEPKASPPYKAGKMAPEWQESALKYMMLYRFLSGVTTSHMSIDPDYVDKCQHAAVVICHLGHLDHKPTKPDDMDEDFFKTGYEGTSASNLAQGPHNLFDAIDMYMDDSDASNIERVGHRLWILTPSLQKTGFGYCGGFSALYTFDGYKQADANWLYIAYPGPGYYPRPMLKNDAAWSLSLNKLKCKIGGAAAVEISVSVLDNRFVITDATDATIVAVNDGMMSKSPSIIFKPGIKHPGVGRYLVQVKGIRTAAGAPAPLSYLVDLREMPATADSH